MRKIVLTTVAIFLLIILIVIIIYIMKYKKIKFIDFEFVTKLDYIDGEVGLYGYDDFYWHSIRSEKYNGWFGTSLPGEYGKKFNDFDLENYTYIITSRHELKSIAYSLSQMKNRHFIILPKDYIGIVTLAKEKTDYIYIYRIKRMNIDYDYHNPSRNVTLE